MRKRLKNKRIQCGRVRDKIEESLTDKCGCNDADSTENAHDVQPDTDVSDTLRNRPSIVNQKLPCVQTKFKDVVDQSEERRKRKRNDEQGAESINGIMSFNESHSTLNRLTQTAESFPNTRGRDPSSSKRQVCNPSSIDCRSSIPTHRFSAPLQKRTSGIAS